MYPGTLVSGFANISVYFNKLANNFKPVDKNLRFLRLTFLLYDLLVSRLFIYCKAVK